MTTIRTTLSISSVLLTFGFAACSPTQTPQITDSASSRSDISSSVTATSNVSYTGIVESIGASVYQQGTHRLVLEDGRFIILATADSLLNLNEYVGKRVEVKGSVQPTVEQGGTIMSVEQVTLIGVSSSSESSQESISSSLSSIVSSTMASSEVSSVASSMKSSTVSSAVQSSAAVSSSQTSVNVGGNLEEQIVLMAKQDYQTAALWSQKYCTTHIGFCIPAHKQWYFVSFGTKAGTMWHVEFAMKDFTVLGDGPIVLNLLSGLSASKGKVDGAIESEGGQLIGYKDWTNNRHFELTADPRLKDAVSYMLSHIATYEFTQ